MKMIAMAQQAIAKMSSLEDLSKGDAMSLRQNFGFGIERVVISVPQSKLVQKMLVYVCRIRP